MKYLITPPKGIKDMSILEGIIMDLDKDGELEDWETVKVGGKEVLEATTDHELSATLKAKLENAKCKVKKLES